MALFATSLCARPHVVPALTQSNHVEEGIKLLKKREYAAALKEAEAALAEKPDFAPALLLKSQALLGSANTDLFGYWRDRVMVSRKFKEAADVLEQYLLRIPFRFNRPFEDDDRQKQVVPLRRYSELLVNTPNTEPALYFSTEVTTQAQIISKTEPGFTPAARQARVSGTVVLLVTLHPDGVVRDVLAVQTLPYGLTDQAIMAAQTIKFIPATKDGRAVPQLIRLEYNFSN